MFLKKFYFWIILVSFLFFASGCTTTIGSKVDYKSVVKKNKKSVDLKLPPELSIDSEDEFLGENKEDRYSEYSSSKDLEINSEPEILPIFSDITMMGEGSFKWLLVEAQPEDLWKIIKNFWISQGFTIAREDFQLGVIETDWAEERIKQDGNFITDFLEEKLDFANSYPKRDRFKIRIERAQNIEKSEIFISHLGMHLVQESIGIGNTRFNWEVLPSDKVLEAEMLRKLMLKISGSSNLKENFESEEITKTTQLLTIDDQYYLVSEENYDLAWKKFGSAIQRSDFTIEDSSKEDGTYTTSYLQKKNDSGLSKLFFWKKKSLKVIMNISVEEVLGKTYLKINSFNSKEINPKVIFNILNKIKNNI